MTKKLNELYGKDIYTDGGNYLGRVRDLLLDLEKGEIVRIAMDSLENASKEEVMRVLRSQTVLYKNVRSVADVIVVSGSLPVPSNTGMPIRRPLPGGKSPASDVEAEYMSQEESGGLNFGLFGK